MDLTSSAELKLLVAAVVIGLVQLVWMVVAGAGGNRDLPWLVGPRDDARPMTGAAARLERAFRNFLETFPLFAAALIAALMAGKQGPLTLWGSGLYVVSRALYVPAYAAGLPWVRTLIWAVSLAGVAMVIVAFFK